MSFVEGNHGGFIREEVESDLVLSPVDGTRRLIRYGYIYNADTVTHVVTIRRYLLNNKVMKRSIKIGSGGEWEFIGLVVLNGSKERWTCVSDSAIVTNSMEYVFDYGDDA